MPGSFQTHFPVLRPINQGYICVGWTSTPRGGGGAQAFVFLSLCAHLSHILYFCACVRGCMCVFATWESACGACFRGGSDGVLCVFFSKDGRRLLMLGLFQPCSQNYSHGQPCLVHCPPASTYYSPSFPPTPPIPLTLTQTSVNTHSSLLCLALLGKGSFFSTCVAHCLYVYFLKLLAHLDLSYPSFFHLCSPVFFLLFFPCLAVMSPVSFQVYS